MIVFKTNQGTRWPWLQRHHPALWDYWYDGLLTKYEVFLSIVGKII